MGYIHLPLQLIFTTHNIFRMRIIILFTWSTFENLNVSTSNRRKSFKIFFSMPLLIVFAGIVLLLLLITVVKVNSIISLLITSIAVGFAMGMDGTSIMKSVEVGVSSTMGQLALILAFGAILGRLLADGGAAQKITDVLTKVFGVRYIPWAMVLTGFLVGIPLFYNVGFIVLVPLVFMICRSNKLPLLYVGIPLLAALSVTHGYLPPHPGATAIAVIFQADIGLTMIYGMIVAVPAIIISGPIFGPFLTSIPHKPPEALFAPQSAGTSIYPGFALRIFTGLFPVFLIALGSFGPMFLPDNSQFLPIIQFLGDPVFALLLT